ncbi:beta-ketoacyl-ACP synthase III [Enterococcus sp. 2201sp1_2201st1_B8_2201SCRN_220225]|uniref:beta-ketoacyl-ACP synthase III n=1 Tax=unclassified Enterococcus TaxID=2608891 RepID=UPI0034A35A11
METYAKIVATASYLPEKIVTNDDLAQILDTSDEWITSRTGIRERRISENENTSDLCSKVAEELLAKSGTKATELDFILVATMSPDYQTPATACLVQGKIGAVHAFAFDLSAACSGFVYALSMAEKLIRTGSKKGLVIGGEVLSKVVDWQDRSTAVLFGDGAGGVLLTNEGDYPLIEKEHLAADGTRGFSLTSGYRMLQSPYALESIEQKSTLTMDGREIFDFVLRDVTKSLQALLGEEASSIDYFLLHQANARILEKVARKLKLPQERFLKNMARYGNTSGATVPILLDEGIQKGTLSLGSQQKVVLSGFGGGLTWGHLVLCL